MAKEVASSLNSSGVFAMVMATLGIVFPIASFPLGFVGGIICSVLGLIFGIIQVRKGSKAWAVTAIVFSILGLIISIAMAAALTAAVNEAISQYNTLQQSGLIDDVRAAADLVEAAQ